MIADLVAQVAEPGVGSGDFGYSSRVQESRLQLMAQPAKESMEVSGFFTLTRVDRFVNLRW